MSRLPRFFITPDQVSDRVITVSGDDVRHINLVLRMKTGDHLLLCDGEGMEYTVRIADVGRSAVRTEIQSRTRQELRAPRVILGQGLPKADKMDLIVQKATELGVAAVMPLVTERTIVKLKDEQKRVLRWQKICREAAMQSDRPDIPAVGPVRSFADFLGTVQTDETSVLLLPWEEATAPIKAALRQVHGVKQVVVLIGPEGGFSRKEADLAGAAGFQTVSLGRNILRTETAAIAVLSMVQYEFLS